MYTSKDLGNKLYLGIFFVRVPVIPYCCILFFAYIENTWQNFGFVVDVNI